MFALLIRFAPITRPGPQLQAAVAAGIPNGLATERHAHTPRPRRLATSNLAEFASERAAVSRTTGDEVKPVCCMARMASPMHEDSSMNNASHLQTIGDGDLLDVTGGYRPTWMAEQAINGGILGVTAGAIGGAAAGALAGSIVPGLGTAGGFASGAIIGGINGAGAGAIYGGVSEFKRQRRDGDTTP